MRELAVARAALGRISATLGFLQSVWWQFLLAGAVAAADRAGDGALARAGHDPAAARHGRCRAADGDRRLLHAASHARSMDEVGQLAARVQPDERRARDARAEPPRAGGERLPRAEDADRRDPRAPGEPARRRRGARPRDAPGDARADASASAGSSSSSWTCRSSSRARCPLHRERGAAGAARGPGRSPRSRSRGATDGVDRRATSTTDLPPVDADPERVHQVLYNLVDNAVRATPGGGTVTIAAHRHNGVGRDRACADTGIGIAPEHLPRVFERFYRVDPARVARRRRHRASGSRSPARSSRRTAATSGPTSEPGPGQRVLVRPARGDRPPTGGTA